MTKGKSVALVESNQTQPILTIEHVKKYICPQASEAEIFTFIKLCEAQNLNPFIREAYLVKYGNKPAQIITGKDTFTKRAQAHPKFRGFRAGIIISRDGETEELEGSFCLHGDKLLGGWAKIYVEDYETPIIAKVSMKEYGKGQSTWNQIPATMIRKVAIVQAMREAFPDQLGGLYDHSEMGLNAGEGDVIDVKVEEVKEPVKKAEKPAPKKTNVKSKKELDPKVRCENAMNKFKLTEEQKNILHSAYSDVYDILLNHLTEIHKGNMNMNDLMEEAHATIDSLNTNSAEDEPKNWDEK